MNNSSKLEKFIIGIIFVVEIIWIIFLGSMIKTHGMELVLKYNILNTHKKPLPDGSIIKHKGYNYRVYYLKE